MEKVSSVPREQMQVHHFLGKEESRKLGKANAFTATDVENDGKENAVQ